MSGRFSVSPRAHADMDSIAARMSEENPERVIRFFDSARSTFERLAENPRIGRVRGFRGADVQGARSWPMEKFKSILVIYLPEEQGVRILRVMHGARDLETELGG